SSKISVYEQACKPLGLHSDFGDGNHLPQDSSHGRAESVKDVRRSAVATDYCAGWQRVHAQVCRSGTDQASLHQVSDQRLIDPTVVGLRADTVDYESGPLNLLHRPSAWDVVHL